MTVTAGSAPPGLLSPSMELLLHLLRARVTPDIGAPDARLKPTLIEMMVLARSHDVLSAVAGGLARLEDIDWVDLLPFVSPAARDTEAGNRFYTQSARNASAALARASVPHVFSKGLAFFFDDPTSRTWRTVSDIDLLIDEADLPKATAVIQSLGYRQSRPGATYTPRLHHHAAPLQNDSTGVFYELHTRMMQAAHHNPFTFNDILAASRILHDDGLQVNVPSPEHRMFHLIAHAQISDWGYAMRRISIKSLLDAVELGCHHSIDWRVVAEYFRMIRAKPEFMGFLLAGHRLMGLETGLESRADATAQRWADQSIATLRVPASRAANALRVLAQYSRMVWQDPKRLEMIWHTCFTSGRASQLFGTVRSRIGI